MLLQEMRKLVEEEAPGPHPTFTLVHALYALLIIDEAKVGRQKLAERLDLGEGSTRTLLRKLKRRKILMTDRAGCHLTEKGKELYRSAKWTFYEFVPRPGLVPGRRAFAVGIRRGAAFVTSGIAERDEAVKAGAEGALILVCREGELVMPGLSNVSKEHPDLARDVIKMARPEDGDAIVVAWGSRAGVVTYGALNAAWSIYEKMTSG